MTKRSWTRRFANVHEQMTSLDQARAEQVMSLIIRRHRDGKEAFKAMLMAIRTQSWPPTEETLSTSYSGTSSLSLATRS